jgi:hypothetical protein
MIEDGSNSLSALEWAWIKILGKSFSPATSLEFEAIFSDRECLEEMGFTYLHKLVLGITLGDLGSGIESMDESAINAVDNEGRTALSWAAQRGDLHALELLLGARADPNISTPSGMAPLHYAAEAGTPLCLESLLAKHANVHCVDHGLHTPLHFAAKHNDSIAYLKPLIRAGIDVNAKTEYSYTPLICAVYQNHHQALNYLLYHGAEIDLRGQYDKTPVMYAIEYNAHDCLRLLLERGADCSLECDIIPTIAHMAATFADTRTIEILLDSNLPKFYYDTLLLEDRNGMTIDEWIDRRIADGECDLNFGTHFNNLMTKLTKPAGIVNELEDGFDTEVFYEASEHWQLIDAIPSRQ